MFDARKELLLPGYRSQCCSAASHSTSAPRLHTVEFCHQPVSIGPQAIGARRYRNRVDSHRVART
jgi:hypothetical protein